MLRLPPRNNPQEDRTAYLPTESEIAAAAAEIRSGWSEAERSRRCQWPERSPEVPEIRVGDLSLGE